MVNSLSHLTKQKYMYTAFDTFDTVLINSGCIQWLHLNYGNYTPTTTSGFESISLCGKTEDSRVVPKYQLKFDAW